MQKSLTVLTSLLCLYGVSANASECIGAGCHISQYGTEPVAVVAPKCPATSSFKPYLSAKGMISILQTKTDAVATYPAIHGLLGSDSSNNAYFQNTLSDDHLRNASYGFKLAYGATTPLKYGSLRGELEVGYGTEAKDDNKFAFSINRYYPGQEFTSETSVFSIMANVFYDFNTGTRFTPYIGAGFGYARVDTELGANGLAGPSSKEITRTPYDFTNKFGDNNFAWQLGAGIAYSVNEKLSIDLGYRYADYGKVDAASMILPETIAVSNILLSNGSVHVTAHEFTLGARYMF